MLYIYISPLVDFYGQTQYFPCNQTKLTDILKSYKKIQPLIFHPRLYDFTGLLSNLISAFHLLEFIPEKADFSPPQVRFHLSLEKIKTSLQTFGYSG